MISDILRGLRIICKLLASLDQADTPVKRREFVRVYGSARSVRWRVQVLLWPIYPDHESFDPKEVVRGKSYRMRLARSIEDGLIDELVGYKVQVTIEND